MHYSHTIGPKLTFGVTLKGIAGVAGLDLDMNKVYASESGGDWKASANIDLSLASSLLSVGKSADGTLYDFKTAKFGSLGVYGLGGAIDVGMTSEPLDGLTLGLSITDLGFIRWRNNICGKISYTDRIIEKVEDALELKAIEGVTTIQMLDFNAHASVKYRMPFYDGLSIGVLGTYQKHFREVRAGLDITPLKLVSLAVSGAYNTYGYDLGAAVNFRLPGINLYLGTDSVWFNMMPKYYLPVDRGITNVTVGLLLAI